MIKKSKKQSKYFAPQTEKRRVCDHLGCQKAGEYRAPKDRTLKEYYWFCLEHVQAYNAKWNYYDGEFQDEAEDLKRRFKFSSKIKYNFGFDFDDGYNIFDHVSYFTAESNIHLTPEEHQGVKIMEIEMEGLTKADLKKAYKKAVKKYHPDVNTDAEAEEKFKVISTTYKSLMSKLSQ